MRASGPHCAVEKDSGPWTRVADGFCHTSSTCLDSHPSVSVQKARSDSNVKQTEPSKVNGWSDDQQGGLNGNATDTLT